MKNIKGRPSDYEQFRNFIANKMSSIYTKYHMSSNFPPDIAVEQLGLIDKPLKSAHKLEDSEDEEEVKTIENCQILQKKNYEVSSDSKGSFNDHESNSSHNSKNKVLTQGMTDKTEVISIKNVEISKMNFLESKKTTIGLFLKGPYKNVKIEKENNSYIFSGADNEKISVRNRISSFLDNLQVIKVC